MSRVDMEIKMCVEPPSIISEKRSTYQYVCPEEALLPWCYVVFLPPFSDFGVQAASCLPGATLISSMRLFCTIWKAAILVKARKKCGEPPVAPGGGQVYGTLPNRVVKSGLFRSTCHFRTLTKSILIENGRQCCKLCTIKGYLGMFSAIVRKWYSTVCQSYIT